jgi:ERCC4-type nuclease
VILVSPAEPAPVCAALDERGVDWERSTHPENFGVDFLWRANETWWGVQRKTLPDFVASFRDGRLQREVAQMRGKVSMPVLVVEGNVGFTMDGLLMCGSRIERITREQWRSMMWTFASWGITVDFVPTTMASVQYVIDMVRWTEKAKHTSLTARPKLVDSAWGTPTNRDWGIHILQGFDGVGPELAGAIFDHFGRVPLSWTTRSPGGTTVLAYEPDLLDIPGVGKGRAKKLIEALR